MTPPGPVGGVAAPRGQRVRGARPKPGALVAAWDLDAIRVGLVMLMAVSIARVHTMIPGIAVLRPGVLLTLGCVGLVMSRPQSVVTDNLFATWPARRIGLLLALACLGAPFGVGFRASVSFLMEVMLPTIIFAGLLVIAVRKAGDLRLLVWSYVASISLLVYQTLFVWGSAEFSGFRRTTSAVMYDANDLGVLLSAGLPLCLLIAQTSAGLPRIVAYGCMIFIPGAIAELGSRGGFLSLIATALTLLVAMPRLSWTRRSGIVLAGVASLVLLAPDGYFTKMKTIVDPGDDYNVTSETGRLAIWERGLENLWPRPLTGVGIGNFARAQWVNQKYNETGQPLRAMSPHNTFLQVAVDLGIPAFLVFFSIVVGVVIGFTRVRSRLPRSWLDESPDRRFIYLAYSYVPVAFVGWSAGAFFVSHAYLVPFYALTAFAASLMYLLRREQSSAGRRSVPVARGPRRAPIRRA